MAKNNAKKVEKKAKKTVGYGADDIQVLEGLEPVRKRPGIRYVHRFYWCRRTPSSYMGDF